MRLLLQIITIATFLCSFTPGAIHAAKTAVTLDTQDGISKQTTSFQSTTDTSPTLTAEMSFNSQFECIKAAMSAHDNCMSVCQNGFEIVTNGPTEMTDEERTEANQDLSDCEDECDDKYKYGQYADCFKQSYSNDNS